MSPIGDILIAATGHLPVAFGLLRRRRLRNTSSEQPSAITPRWAVSFAVVVLHSYHPSAGYLSYRAGFR